MGGRDQKLVEEVLNNPRDVRFEGACRVAHLLGFEVERQKGTSHRVLKRPGEMTQLNFQKKGDGKIPPYQARQLIEMIEKYWEE